MKPVPAALYICIAVAGALFAYVACEDAYRQRKRQRDANRRLDHVLDSRAWQSLRVDAMKAWAYADSAPDDLRPDCFVDPHERMEQDERESYMDAYWDWAMRDPEKYLTKRARAYLDFIKDWPTTDDKSA